MWLNNIWMAVVLVVLVFLVLCVGGVVYFYFNKKRNKDTKKTLKERVNIGIEQEQEELKNKYLTWQELEKESRVQEYLYSLAERLEETRCEDLPQETLTTVEKQLYVEAYTTLSRDIVGYTVEELKELIREDEEYLLKEMEDAQMGDTTIAFEIDDAFESDELDRGKAILHEILWYKENYSANLDSLSDKVSTAKSELLIALRETGYNGVNEYEQALKRKI